jgi:lipoprotein-releasing system ATP-binding protein
MNNGTAATSRPPLLQGTEIYKSFRQGVTVIEVLKGINIEVDTGEMVAIVGASGSGKTTLLQILGTLDAPSGGTIIFDGRDLGKAREKDLSRHRNENVGFIFQFHHLLDQVNLSHRENHRSGELSGGEQQRVALARALIMQPALLLADEPTGNLDSTSGRQVFDLLREMSRSLSLSVIMGTHNQELAADMDRRLTLNDGLLTS